MTHAELTQLFEDAYKNFHGLHRRDRDPISRVHRYRDPNDREVVALIAATLAYGNVTSILKSIDVVLEPLGAHPAAWIRAHKGGCAIPPTFRHRFTTAEDLEILLSWVGSALRSHGSLDAFFAESLGPSTAHSLSNFVVRLTGQPLPRTLQPVAESRRRNLKYLLSNPSDGSACKRLCLFLRWMVRNEDGIDLGVWKSLTPDQLILPVDTHLLKTLRHLGWTQSNTASWKVAVLATEKLRKLSPSDPLRYDFALCHLSMSGQPLPFVPRLG